MMMCEESGATGRCVTLCPNNESCLEQGILTVTTDPLRYPQSIGQTPEFAA